MLILRRSDIREALSPLAQALRSISREWQERSRRLRLAENLDFTRQAAHDYRRSCIESNDPFMTCRFGWNELHTLLEYGRLVTSYHKGQRYEPSQYSDKFRDLAFQAGFFPITHEEMGITTIGSVCFLRKLRRRLVKLRIAEPIGALVAVSRLKFYQCIL
jgi:hypothetical protein